jgi:hypothetical protein
VKLWRRFGLRLQTGTWIEDTVEQQLHLRAVLRPSLVAWVCFALLIIVLGTCVPVVPFKFCRGCWFGAKFDLPLSKRRGWNDQPPPHENSQNPSTCIIMPLASK